MSYGVSCHDKFDRSKHREEDKVWAEDRYEYRADNQIRWFLKEVFYVLKHLVTLDLLLTHIFAGR